MLEPIEPEQLAEIEAGYTPVRPFLDWTRDVAIDESDWLAELATFDVAKTRAKQEDLDRAVKIAARIAAFETGLIERLYATSDRGMTITVAKQAFAWQQALRDDAGDAAEALFEAQLAGYNLVLDVATKRSPVSEAWIRGLHATLTEPQDTYEGHTPDGQVIDLPMLKGAYKEQPNHVRLRDDKIHAYAPVMETPVEMERLVAELQSEPFEKAHPILQAAYAHHGLVAIHPFCDGNGRVARALGSVYTYRAASVPLLIFEDQRDTYFDALAAADSGQPEAFTQLVFEAAIAGVRLVVDYLSAARVRPSTESIDSIRLLLTAQGGLSYHQVDEVAKRLVSEFDGVVRRAIAAQTLTAGVEMGVASQGGGGPEPREGYRRVVGQPPHFIVQFRSPTPAAAAVDMHTAVFVNEDKENREVFLLAVLGWPDMVMSFRITEVVPETTIAARFRMEAFATQMLGAGFEDLNRMAAASFDGSGYR